jgi:hypothetical protein
MRAGTLNRAPANVSELLDPALAARLDRLDVLSRKTFAGKLQGERRSKRRGRSVEFDDYREYVAGDDLRFIDWNVMARLDRLFIKVFQEEEDLALHLIIDASPSMNAGEGAWNKLLYASRLAMALGYIGLVNNNRVLCSVVGAPSEAGRPGTMLRRLEPLRGRRTIERLSKFLVENAFAGLRAGVGGELVAGESGASLGFGESMRRLAGERSGKGVYVLLSDLLIPPVDPPGYAEGLRYLSSMTGGAGGGGGATGAGQEVYVLQLLAPAEIDPAREGDRAPGNGLGGLDGRGVTGDAPSANRGGLVGDLRLTDVESGRAAEVTLTPELMDDYRATVRRYVSAAHAFCAARGLSHEMVSTETDAATLLTGTLRRIGMLR